MFTYQEFKSVLRILSVYCSSVITPGQVMDRLRQQQKMTQIEILSFAFEEMPGYMNYTIQEFIDLMRLKTIIQ